MIEQLWIRVGDCGDYEPCNGLNDALAYLNELNVGEVTGWTNGPCAVGFETSNFWGQDCISCYFGDADANLIRPLNAAERAAVEDGLKEAYI